MKIGMVGLGRMGANLTRRLIRDGHEVVVNDVDPAAIERLTGDGAIAGSSLDALVAALPAPRVVWIMVPAGEITEGTVKALAERLEPGDTIIDGGNSYYRDDIRRSKEFADRGVHYVDIGTSGGVFGLERGYCLMVGGEDDIVASIEPILRTIAPGVDAAERTPGRSGEPGQEEYGYLHCGPSGAGHFVKMVHNGIEYALMAAYAEGLNILKHADAGNHVRDADAETAPMADPDAYRYEIDVPAVTELWRRGSVVGSWLLDLTAIALTESPTLDGFAGRVSDSGEGRWTAIAAIDEGVPTPVLTAALYSRFASRNADEFGNKVLSAMRKQFGGHDEKHG